MKLLDLEREWGSLLVAEEVEKRRLCLLMGSMDEWRLCLDFDFDLRFFEKSVLHNMLVLAVLAAGANGGRGGLTIDTARGEETSALSFSLTVKSGVEDSNFEFESQNVGLFGAANRVWPSPGTLLIGW